MLVLTFTSLNFRGLNCLIFPSADDDTHLEIWDLDFIVKTGYSDLATIPDARFGFGFHKNGNFGFSGNF